MTAFRGVIARHPIRAHIAFAAVALVIATHRRSADGPIAATLTQA
ncbi:MAG: hypothetical protein ACJ761_07130 [Chloroflexota bacterium]